jgi:phosphoribosylanthranilate isomerase
LAPATARYRWGMAQTPPHAAEPSLSVEAPREAEAASEVDAFVHAVTPPKVKICGITNLDDAEMALEMGAWALGMIFFPDSPRRCSLAEAQRIVAALRRRVELCGVFMNAPLDEVVHTSEDLGLSMLQLHGDEGPSFCAEAARRNGARVIKAAQVSGPGDVRDLERFHVDFHLLDSRSRTPEKRGLRGGTGETFDWTLMAERRSKVPLILSGGLTAENVAEAIALARPYAVDSASGTEAAPGRKDPRKLRALFDAVQGGAVDRSEMGRTPAAGGGAA